MSDEPGHKAMLYFLEVLMNSPGPLTISQLAGRFGSSNFTADMRTAAGGNESGLKQFLLKYPSLFTIKGNMVSLCDGKDDEEPTAGGSVGQDGSTGGTSGRGRSLPDVSMEMDAVQFFQSQLAKREERWVPVRSLAGHLSQTTSEIRNIVGPQLDFKKWLLRHMHIFEVQGDLVSLREGLAPPATPTTPRRITFDLPGDDDYANPPTITGPPPKTPPSKRKSFIGVKAPNPPLPIHRSHSFGDRNQLSGQGSSPSTPVPLRRHEPPPVTMTASEYNAVMYVKDLLERKGQTELMSLVSLIAAGASEAIRTTIGPTKSNLETFLRRNLAIFDLPTDAESVDLVKNAKLSVIITSGRPTSSPVNQSDLLRPSQGGTGGSNAQGDPSRPAPIVHQGKGKIFHVAKLWGIIDLGEHEHVFFDRSIMKQPIDDLQKHFQTGEMLSFTATPAHKSSRAKWRATHVWRGEDEPTHHSDDQDESPGGSIRGGDYLNQSSGSIEDEMNEFLPHPDHQSASSPLPSSSSLSSTPVPPPVQIFTDAQLSGAGVIPIWNFRGDEDRNGGRGATVSVVPESYQMSASALSDLRFIPEFSPSFLYGGGGVPGGGEGVTNGQAGRGEIKQLVPPPAGVKVKKYASVACQTVSTSDIIATQLYQDS